MFVKGLIERLANTTVALRPRLEMHARLAALPNPERVVTVSFISSLVDAVGETERLTLGEVVTRVSGDIALEPQDAHTALNKIRVDIVCALIPDAEADALRKDIEALFEHEDAQDARDAD